MSRCLPDGATGARVKALIPKGRGKRLRLFGRGLALAVLLVSILAACGSEPPDSPPPDDPPPASSFDESPSTRAPAPGLTLRTDQVGDYRYRIFTPAADSRFGLTLTRPSADDSEILLSVAGTYTSPDDDVLGVVLIDGVEERSQRMGWGGALVLVDGQAEVRSLPGGRLGPAERKALEAQRASLIQGHLLVHGGRASSLKSSQPLQRRAVALLDGAAVIVESEGLVELGRFAEHLMTLGATAALNLDMGKWSEGWYRLGDGTVQPLGLDRRSTGRQSNWLVIERRPDGSKGAARP